MDYPPIVVCHALLSKKRPIGHFSVVYDNLIFSLIQLEGRRFR